MKLKTKKIKFEDVKILQKFKLNGCEFLKTATQIINYDDDKANDDQSVVNALDLESGELEEFSLWDLVEVIE